MPLAGGLVSQGYQCGQIPGAVLAAGAQAYRLYGAGPQTETRAITAAQRLVEAFRVRAGAINCREITGIDIPSATRQTVMLAFLRGGVIRCFRMVTSYSRAAYSEINTTLAEKRVQALPAPVSCAALLAQKMGASDLHTVMAAGFAGGIGLSGGACGALGAAIWLTEMNWGKAQGTGKMQYTSRRALELIDHFAKTTDSQFECCKLVGRRFENVQDHANYLREGGCSQIIQALASLQTSSAE